MTGPGQKHGESRVTCRSCAAVTMLTVLCSAGGAHGQSARAAGRTAPSETCTPLTQARADASAGQPNVRHDGTSLPGVQPPDISKGFVGIPRSAQPRLTAAQRRIVECSYRLPEAGADMPYALFVPSAYNPKTPAPLVVDLHGYDITPLQQILFDGTADFAERHGFIVLAPMGYSVTAGWGMRVGPLAGSSSSRPGGGQYSIADLSELDAMTALKRIREQYTIDPDRIYLTGHSMGGGGTYYLGAKYKDIWAGLAPIAGLGGIADAAAAAPYTSIPMLVLHGKRIRSCPPGFRDAACWRCRLSAPRTSTSRCRGRTTNSGSAAALATWKRCFCSSAWYRSAPASDISPWKRLRTCLHQPVRHRRFSGDWRNLDASGADCRLCDHDCTVVRSRGPDTAATGIRPADGERPARETAADAGRDR